MSLRKDHSAEYFRFYRYRTKYNLPPAQLGQLLELQVGACAICQVALRTQDAPDRAHKPVCVDHDHSCCSGPPTCGRCTRGLVCHRCKAHIALIEAGRIGPNTRPLVEAIRAYLANPPARRLRRRSVLIRAE